MGSFVKFALPLAVVGAIAWNGKANATVVINMFDSFSLAGTGLVTSATGTVHGVNTAPYIGDAYVDFGSFTGPANNRVYHATTSLTYKVNAPGHVFDGDGDNGIPDTGSVTGIVFFSPTAHTVIATTLPTVTFAQSDSGEQFSFTASDITDSVNYTSGVVFINLLLHGTLTGTGIEPFGPEAASMSWTFTSSSGNSYTGSGSISDPPVDAPEPATLAVLGMSLAGLGFIRRSRA